MINKEQLFLQAQDYLDKHFESEIYQCVFFDKQTIPDYIDALDSTFSQKVFDFIKKKGVSEQDCYKNANLDRRLFSKIRSNDNYQPKKSTVFALIFGMKLNLDEAEDLLEVAGYSISHSLKQDVLIEFLVKNKIYDIITVNEVLYKYDCPLLGNIK